MKIEYIGHSGFLAETESALLLFDYYRGDLSGLKKRKDRKPLFVFASHAHSDHYNPEIFSLADGERETVFLLSSDIRGDRRVPRGRDVRWMDADATCEIGGLGRVRTFVSTDEGTAFLVTTPGETLFHAGDLNFWDWPGEDPAWLREQETVFTREIRKIGKDPIDAAFVVLDDRLEENFANGLRLFLACCRPRYVLPMHFRKGSGVVERFRKLPGVPGPGAVILDTEREKLWEI